MGKILTRIEVITSESVDAILKNHDYITNDGLVYIKDGARYKVCAIHHHDWTNFISYIDMYPLD